MPTALPQARTFLTSLLTSLSSATLPPKATTSEPQQPQSRNPLRDLSPNQRAALLTLHVIYPNELLPALDLLDRDLITRLILITEQSTRVDKQQIYYVQSAHSSNHQQQSSSRTRYHHRNDSLANKTHYQVRLQSWSCSCPAFAFAAFPSKLPSIQRPESVRAEGDGLDDEDDQMKGLTSPRPAHESAKEADHQQTAYPKESWTAPEAEAEAEGKREWMVGGLSLGEDVPICKHLLACVLVERTGLFGGFVREREVGVEEWVGWAAGWGG